MSEKYSFAELFNKTNKLFGHNLQAFFIVALVIAVILTAMDGMYVWDIESQGYSYIDDVLKPQAEYNEDILSEEEFTPIVSNSLWVTILGSLVGLFLYPFYLIGKVLVYLKIEGDKHDISEALGIIVAKYWKILLMMLLYFGTIFVVAFMLGFLSILLAYVSLVLTILVIILIVVFAVAFIIYLMFIFDSLLLRDKAIFESVKYSVNLVKDNFWRTVGYMFLMGLIMLIPIMVLRGLQVVIENLVTNVFSMLAIGFVQMLINELMGFYLLSFMVYYFIALENEKGFLKGKKAIIDSK